MSNKLIIAVVLSILGVLSGFFGNLNAGIQTIGTAVERNKAEEAAADQLGPFDAETLSYYKIVSYYSFSDLNMLPEFYRLPNKNVYVALAIKGLEHETKAKDALVHVEIRRGSLTTDDSNSKIKAVLMLRNQGLLVWMEDTAIYGYLSIDTILHFEPPDDAEYEIVWPYYMLLEHGAEEDL